MKNPRPLLCSSFLLVLLLLSLPERINLRLATALANPPFPEQVNSWFSNQTSIRADFDGDHQSDLAIGRSDGHTYKVEVQFSTQQEKATIALSRGEFGISLFACDVDQDNDQDLVVASAISLYPVAVLLSDGNGHFEEGNRWLCINFLARDNPSGYDPNSSQANQVSINADERLPFDRPLADFLAAKLEAKSSITCDTQELSLQTLPYHLTARSPPPDLAI